MNRQQRHEALDVLAAEYWANHPDKLPSNTSIMDLLKWNHRKLVEEAGQAPAPPQDEKTYRAETEKFLEQFQPTFGEVIEGVIDNELVLMRCVDKLTGKDVAALCLSQRRNETDWTVKPLAIFIEGKPFDRLIPPPEMPE
jgi:hypothetical protein